VAAITQQIQNFRVIRLIQTTDGGDQFADFLHKVLTSIDYKLCRENSTWSQHARAGHQASRNLTVVMLRNS